MWSLSMIAGSLRFVPQRSAAMSIGAKTAILEHLGRQHQAMVALLADLVNIDSGSYNKRGVDAVGDRLRAFLEAAGISSEVIPHASYGDCMAAPRASPCSLPGAGSGPRSGRVHCEQPRFDWIETVLDARQILFDKISPTLRRDAEQTLEKLLYRGAEACRCRSSPARRARCCRRSAADLPLFARRYLP